MTNSKHTKKALFSSVIALILCCSMLIGTTYAWFTDEVKSMSNVITAGNLDIKVTNENGDDIQGQETLFQEVELWEPGVVSYENLTIENVGTLALQYDLLLNFVDVNKVSDNGLGLSDVLQIAIVEGGIDADVRADLTANAQITWEGLKDFSDDGKLLPGEKRVIGVAIWWQPGSAEEDNKYNVNGNRTTTDGNPLKIDIGFQVFATQVPEEKDSFDQWYDLTAKVPAPQVNQLTPKAITATVGMFGGQVHPYELDVYYQFLPTETKEEALASGYGYWHADFVIKVDKDIQSGQAGLAGWYSAWCDPINNGNWVALIGDLKAGEEVRLVQSLGNGGITVNYSEICQFGINAANSSDGFHCGAWADESLDGMTLTVELRIYETKGDPADPNGPKNIETGNSITIGTYTHTFSQSVSTRDELQAAIDAAQNGTLITLGADIVGDVTVTQKAGVAFTIDGKGHNYTGSINVDGKSARYADTGLTIKNMNFVGESITEDACIRLGLGDNSTRYTNNVTVDSCTFDIPGKVAVKSYTGGDLNTVIKDCVVTSRCHSLAQLANVETGLVISGCDVYSKNGINLNSTETAAIIDCDINVTGYAVRYGSGSAANTETKYFTIENSSLKSACDDGDGVIMFRGNAVKAELTLVETTVEGTTPVKGNTAETVIIGLN